MWWWPVPSCRPSLAGASSYPMTPILTLNSRATVAPSFGSIQYTPFLPSFAAAGPGDIARVIAALTAPPRSARLVLIAGTTVSVRLSATTALETLEVLAALGLRAAREGAKAARDAIPCTRVCVRFGSGERDGRVILGG